MPSSKRKAPKAFNENPPWTAKDFERARPLAEVMPDLAAFAKNRRGRPKSETTKEAISLRVDANVVATFRATGPGWQGRMNEVLGQAAKKLARV